MNEKKIVESLFGDATELMSCGERVAYQLVPNHQWILVEAIQAHPDPTFERLLAAATNPKKHCHLPFKGLEAVVLYNIQPRHEVESVGLAQLFG